MLITIGKEVQQESINNLHKDREELKQIDQEKYPLKKSFETEEPTSFGLWDFGVFILPKSKALFPYILISTYIILLTSGVIFAAFAVFLDDTKFNELISFLTLQPSEKEQQMFGRAKQLQYEILRKIEQLNMLHLTSSMPNHFGEERAKQAKKELEQELNKIDSTIEDLEEDFNKLDTVLGDVGALIKDKYSENDIKVVENLKFKSKFFTKEFEKTDDFDFEIVKSLIIKNASLGKIQTIMPHIFQIIISVSTHVAILAFTMRFTISQKTKLEQSITNYLYIYFFNNAHHLVRKSDYEIYEYITELSLDYSKITVEFFNFVFSMISLIILIIFSIYLIRNTETIFTKTVTEEIFSFDLYVDHDGHLVVRSYRFVKDKFTEDQYNFLMKNNKIINKIITEKFIELQRQKMSDKNKNKLDKEEISQELKKELEKELNLIIKKCKKLPYIMLAVGIGSFIFINFLGVFFKYRSIQEKKVNNQKQEGYKGALMNGFKSSKLLLANDFTSYKNRVLTSIKNSDNSSNLTYTILSGLIDFISFILLFFSSAILIKLQESAQKSIIVTKEKLLSILVFCITLINSLPFSDYGSSYINIQSKIGIFKEIKEKQEQEKYYLEKAKNDETKYNYEKDDLIIDGVKTPFLNYPFTLVLKKGAHLSLTGPTGVGKSTFVDCLTRYSEIYDGKIIYNNKDIRSNPYWKSQLIFSPQKDALILTISFKENVAFGLPNIDEDIVNKALTLADIKHIVDKNGGLEALPPTSLSGGEQARLLMARVFYFILKYPKSVKIIILDESNSGMDQRTARKVFGNLFKIGEENGTIFISILHHEIEGDDNKGVLELSFTKDPVIRTTKGYDKVFSSIKQYNHSLKNINTLHNNNSDLDNIDNDIDNNDDNNDNDIDDDSSLDEDDNSSDQEDL